MYRLPFGDDENQPKPIYARSGWEIPQPSISDILLESQKQTLDLIRIRTHALIDTMARNNKKNLLVRSMSPHMYNCVGMIFSNRRAWIEISDIYDILKEDGYNQISVNHLTVGDVVLYTQYGIPSHVGLIISVYDSVGQIPNIRVLSKWGKDAEIEHHLVDVPEQCGQPTAYYSEKIQ